MPDLAKRSGPISTEEVDVWHKSKIYLVESR